MSIRKMTIEEAASSIWGLLWRGAVWAFGIGLSCHLLSIDVSWRIGVICALSTFLSELLAAKMSPAERGTPGVSHGK